MSLCCGSTRFSIRHEEKNAKRKNIYSKMIWRGDQYIVFTKYAFRYDTLTTNTAGIHLEHMTAETINLWTCHHLFPMVFFVFQIVLFILPFLCFLVLNLNLIRSIFFCFSNVMLFSMFVVKAKLQWVYICVFLFAIIY